ncbi:MAG: mannose-1-phosphate guanylyltransferase [Actinomycetales bacterium]
MADISADQGAGPHVADSGPGPVAGAASLGSDDRSIPGFAAVIPAGGAGTRLWPLSRAAAPKFLHDLTGGGRTLVQATYDRVAPLAGDGVLVVTGAAHVRAVSEQLPQVPAQDLLAEPSPRDSMAAIGLAAAVLARRNPDAVLGSFAADHVITRLADFESAVVEAVAAARAGYVATIGITPAFPATGFGYIRAAGDLGAPGTSTAQRVAEFVEKPDIETASRYLASGEYYWNAGMFVVGAQVLLDHLGTQLPALRDGLVQIAQEIEAGNADKAFTEIWPGLTKIAIDHAIAEPVAARGGVAVVPGTFGWDDVGDWHSLADLLPGGNRPGGLALLGDADRVVTQDASGIIVPAGERLVAVVGMQDVVVVDTPDAVMVTTRGRAQDVKKIVDQLKSAGRTHLV